MAVTQPQDLAREMLPSHANVVDVQIRESFAVAIGYQAEYFPKHLHAPFFNLIHYTGCEEKAQRHS
jgi:hypothetical protein